MGFSKIIAGTFYKILGWKFSLVARRDYPAERNSPIDLQNEVQPGRICDKILWLSGLQLDVKGKVRTLLYCIDLNKSKQLSYLATLLSYST